MAWWRRKPAAEAKAMQPVGRSLWQVIHEPFTGAWQMNRAETVADILSYPTLYACIHRIASDVGKLPFVVRRWQSGVWADVPSSPLDGILKLPNRYQTAGQFREWWMVSKLSAGNTYALKQRNGAGAVEALYVLDPHRVRPMVADSGNVYYELQTGPQGLPDGYPGQNLVVPASDIIHDRCVTLHHPLIGVPPVTAATWPTVKNLKIMRNATEFFENNAAPGGLLTAPAGMSEKDAAAVQEYWNKNFTGANAGRVAIIGADMKFTPFAMKSIDAQMIEQMKYSDEQICQPFGIHPFKVGIGSIPSGLSVDGLNQLYYSDALQTHIERMEELLNTGLNVAQPTAIQLDLEPLLRMDEGKRADVETKKVQGMVSTPNEARARFNLRPTDGGDTLWGQNQDYPLGMLADRASWDENMRRDSAQEAAAAIESAKRLADQRAKLTKMLEH